MTMVLQVQPSWQQSKRNNRRADMRTDYPEFESHVISHEAFLLLTTRLGSLWLSLFSYFSLILEGLVRFLYSIAL